MNIANCNSVVETPTLSVCIPTFNRRELLEKTLESLNNQTFQNYEIIVCDDCSTDGTWEFLRSLKWPRLKVLRNEQNLHLPGNMTRLFKEASGKYVGMQHDHDLYSPVFIERMTDIMEQHPSAGFGCCAYHLLDDDGRMSAPDVAEFQLFPLDGLLPGRELVRILATRIHTPIPAMSTVFRRDVVEKAGGYRPDWGLAADEDLYRRVASISDVAYCHERLFTMRARPQERRSIMGSWQGLHTVYELRHDITENDLRETPLFQTVNKARLTANLYKALLVESLVLWSYGEKANLKKAFGAKTIRHGKKVLNPFSRLLVYVWISLLSATSGCGRRFRQRHGDNGSRVMKHKEVQPRGVRCIPCIIPLSRLSYRPETKLRTLPGRSITV